MTKMHKTKAARIVGMKCCSLQDPNKTMVPAQSIKGCMQCRCCFDRSIVVEHAANKVMAKRKCQDRMSAWALPIIKCLTRASSTLRTFSHTCAKGEHDLSNYQEPHVQMIQTCPKPALLRAVFSGASPPSSALLQLCPQIYLRLPVALHRNQQLVHNNSKQLPLHQRSTTRTRNNISARKQLGGTETLTCAST